MSIIDESLSAENTFTTPILVVDNDYDLSIRGTFSAILHLQRKLPGEADSEYRDVSSFTSPDEQLGRCVSSWYYRIGIKTGNYTSGTAKVNIIT
jgi:hypothetical protein